MDHPLVLALFLAVAAAGAWRVLANLLRRNFRHFAHEKQLATSVRGTQAITDARFGQDVFVLRCLAVVAGNQLIVCICSRRWNIAVSASAIEQSGSAKGLAQRPKFVRCPCLRPSLRDGHRIFRNQSICESEPRVDPRALMPLPLARQVASWRTLSRKCFSDNLRLFSTYAIPRSMISATGPPPSGP
jgi:hypothetical protein